MSADEALLLALLTELAAAPDGVSLPRLCKRLGVRMSVLLRTLAWLGDARFGDVQGPGWVHMIQDGARTLAQLTESGHAAFASLGGRAPHAGDG